MKEQRLVLEVNKAHYTPEHLQTSFARIKQMWLKAEYKADATENERGTIAYYFDPLTVVVVSLNNWRSEFEVARRFHPKAAARLLPSVVKFIRDEIGVERFAERQRSLQAEAAGVEIEEVELEEWFKG